MQLQVGLGASLGIFSLSSAVIIGAAILLAKSADVIADRSGWGRLWVGTLLLAGATSLPELVTNVAAVRIDAPSLAAGDILGANMLNVSKLTLLVALLGSRDFFRCLSGHQMKVAGISLGLTVLVMILLLLQPPGKWFGISPGAAAILVAYGGAWLLLRRYTAGQTGPSEVAPDGSHSLRWGWMVFGISTALIVAGGPLLAASAQQIAHLSGIAESFVGVLAVGFVTSLPELTAAGAAIRLGAADLAVSGIYGTNAFNIAILGIADLFYTQGTLFTALDQSHVAAALVAIVLTLLGMSQIKQRVAVRNFSLTQPSTTLIVGLYAIGLYAVYSLG